MCPRGKQGFNWAIGFLDRVGRRQKTCLLALFALTLLTRWGLSLTVEQPIPKVHDEFSYLLAADTFASGRIANPAHPLSEFFETTHVLSQPTYASKFQPGQGLMLALGQHLFGHPFWGVTLGMAAFVSGIYWMLRGWLPGGWALLGALYTMLTFGFGNYWSESYWGGALAAAASACLVGAVWRLSLEGQPRFAWIAGIAGVGLFLTRPYEGGVLFLVCSTWFLWRAWRAEGTSRLRYLARVVAPIAIVTVIAGAAHAYYNYRVTGDPLRLPYLLHDDQYDVVPVLRLPPLETAAEGGNALAFTMSLARKARNLPRRLYRRLDTFLPGVALVGLLIIPFGWHTRSMRLLTAAALLLVVALCFETFLLLHYTSPLIVVLLGIIFTGLRSVRTAQMRGRRIGPVLANLVLSVITIMPALNALYFVVQGKDKDHSRLGIAMAARDEIGRQLDSSGQRHVVFVTYRAGHTSAEGWIYNKADIDASTVVWARDLGAERNKALLNYYDDREFWRVEADVAPDVLHPYPE